MIPLNKLKNITENIEERLYLSTCAPLYYYITVFTEVFAKDTELSDEDTPGLSLKWAKKRYSVHSFGKPKY